MRSLNAHTASYAVAHGSLAIRVALARKREGEGR